MSPAILQLLQRCFHAHELVELAELARFDVRVSLCEGARVVPVVLDGITCTLVHVRGESPFAPAVRAMIRVELGDGALRLDVPVEVIAAGKRAAVLRMLAAPLVLRRRIVRDEQLRAALEAPPARARAVA